MYLECIFHVNSPKYLLSSFLGQWVIKEDVRLYSKFFEEQGDSIINITQNAQKCYGIFQQFSIITPRIHHQMRGAHRFLSFSECPPSSARAFTFIYAYHNLAIILELVIPI
jgi:hypothetical protein